MDKEFKEKLFTYALPAIAGMFILFMIVHIMRTNFITSEAPALTPPTVNFTNRIAGIGIVEPISEVIKISAESPGVVTSIYVKEHDKVKKDDPLFQIDPNGVMFVLKTSEAQISLDEVRVEDASVQFDFYNSVTDKKAVSAEEIAVRKFALLKAKAELELSKAKREEILDQLNVLTVKAPIDGEILKVNIRLGEYAVETPIDMPLLLMADTSRYNVRVQIDEVDLGRFDPTQPAYGFIRGNAEVKIPLTFVRLDPVLVAKGQISSDATELIDTRVLEVVYTFDNQKYRTYIGQQMDFYINAPAGLSYKLDQ